jgi:hypothetical protein
MPPLGGYQLAFASVIAERSPQNSCAGVTIHLRQRHRLSVWKRMPDFDPTQCGRELNCQKVALIEVRHYERHTALYSAFRKTLPNLPRFDAWRPNRSHTRGICSLRMLELRSGYGLFHIGKHSGPPNRQTKFGPSCSGAWLRRSPTGCTRLHSAGIVSFDSVAFPVVI